MRTIDSAAEFLYHLRKTRALAEGLPKSLLPENFRCAYAIQDKLVERILGESPGASVIGYKAACTNSKIQSMFGLSEPLFGQLLKNRSYSSGARVPGVELVTRCIETEFSFRISRDIPFNHEEYSLESIGEFVDAVIPSMEIVETHYTNWTAAGAKQLVADNAIHGCWIAGDPIPFSSDFDFSTHQTRLYANERLVREGSGANVLGNPLRVVCWLVQELQKYGKSLRGGEVVTTGLTTDVYLAQPGETLRADFGTIGNVECVVE